MPIEWVTIKKFAVETGYTEKAVRAKIERGDWLRGQVWTKAPDGRILLSIEGFNRWVSINSRASPPQARHLKSSAQRRRIEIWLHITWHIVCLFINGIDDPAATSR